MRKPQREMEIGNLFNKIQNFVEKHPLKNRIHNFTHHHHLTFYEEKPDGDEVFCDACQKRVSGTAYCCSDCNFFIHKSCAELPQHINHPFHKNHRLTLLQHFSQSLPEESCNSEYSCSCCCTLPICGTTYRYTSCNFFLHKSCLELPSQIKHPYHPSHYLSLCVKPWGGFVYQCQQTTDCDFEIEISCIFHDKPIQDPNLMHVLSIIEKKPFLEMDKDEYELVMRSKKDDYCLVCGESIPWEQPHLHCKLCKFTLHLKCVGPIVASKLHNHPLTFTNSHVEEHGSGERSCDSCGIERKRAGLVYNCLECGYVAHCRCVFTKGELLVAHKLGNDIELDTSTVVITKERKFYLEDIIGMVSESEQRKIEEDCVEAELNDKVEARNQLFMDKQELVSLQSNKAFTQFLERFESTHEDPWHYIRFEDDDSWSEVSNLGNYVTLRKYVPVLRTLFAKYGDFSAASPISPLGKTYFFTVLCGAIYEMCNTKEGEISEDQLFEWWDYFRIVEKGGFEVRFAFDRLKKAIFDHFGVGSNVYTDPNVAQFDREMKKLGLLIREVERNPYQFVSKDRFVLSRS